MPRTTRIPPYVFTPDDEDWIKAVRRRRTAVNLLKRRTNKTPEFPHGPSIKWPKVYEALRREGHDKSTSAAISNAHWNKYRRWGRAGDPGPRSAEEYERTRGRKARRRKGIPLPKSRQRPIAKADLTDSIAKHNSPIHPGTGTDQSVHGSGGGGYSYSRLPQPSDFGGGTAWRVGDRGFEEGRGRYEGTRAHFEVVMIQGNNIVVRTDNGRRATLSATNAQLRRLEPDLFDASQLDDAQLDLTRMGDLADELGRIHVDELRLRNRSSNPSLRLLRTEALRGRTQSRADVIESFIAVSGGLDLGPQGLHFLYRDDNGDIKTGWLRGSDAWGPLVAYQQGRPEDGVNYGTERGFVAELAARENGPRGESITLTPDQILDEAEVWRPRIVGPGLVNNDETIDRLIPSSGSYPTEEAALAAAEQYVAENWYRLSGDAYTGSTREDLDARQAAALEPLAQMLQEHRFDLADPTFIAANAPEWRSTVGKLMRLYNSPEMTFVNYNVPHKDTVRTAISDLRDSLWSALDGDTGDIDWSGMDQFPDGRAVPHLMLEALGRGVGDEYEWGEGYASGIQNHLGLSSATEVDPYTVDNLHQFDDAETDIENFHTRLETTLLDARAESLPVEAFTRLGFTEDQADVIADMSAGTMDLVLESGSYYASQREQYEITFAEQEEQEQQEYRQSARSSYTTPSGTRLDEWAAQHLEGDYANGFSVEVDDASGSTVDASVLKDGRVVGEIKFGMGYGTTFGGDYMKLNESVQGDGFATELLAKLYDPLVDAGYERVSVGANITVGGYSWAKLGLEFSGGEIPQYARQRLTAIANLTLEPDSEIEPRLFPVERRVVFTDDFKSEFSALSQMEWTPELEERMHDIIKPETVAEARSLLEGNPSAQLVALTGWQNRARLGDHKWHLGKMALIGGSWTGTYDIGQGNPMAMVLAAQEASKPEKEAAISTTATIPSLTLRPPTAADLGAQDPLFTDFDPGVSGAESYDRAMHPFSGRNYADPTDALQVGGRVRARDLVIRDTIIYGDGQTARLANIRTTDNGNYYLNFLDSDGANPTDVDLGPDDVIDLTRSSHGSLVIRPAPSTDPSTPLNSPAFHARPPTENNGRYVNFIDPYPDSERRFRGGPYAVRPANLIAGDTMTLGLDAMIANPTSVYIREVRPILGGGREIYVEDVDGNTSMWTVHESHTMDLTRSTLDNPDLTLR